MEVSGVCGIYSGLYPILDLLNAAQRLRLKDMIDPTNCRSRSGHEAEYQ
jgi:hypothetical protein